MITWQEALTTLKHGHQRFMKNKMDVLHHNLQLLANETQHPCAIILCCSDSRVSPTTIFDQSLGQLFVIQNAGNVSDTAVWGSIQYAIQYLKTPLLIVLGHTGCGAVTAAHEHKKMKGPLHRIIAQIDAQIVEYGTVDDSIKNHTLVMAQMLNQAVQQHQDQIVQDMKVIPAIYNMSNGEINWLDIRSSVAETGVSLITENE